MQGRLGWRALLLGLALFAVAGAVKAEVFTVSSAADGGMGSLREAIQAANALPNGASRDEVRFAIPGSGPHTIQLASTLPAVTDPVVIDGGTQSGYIDTPLIELDGREAGAVNGLEIRASDSVLKGLRVVGFTGAGVSLEAVAHVEVSHVVLCRNWAGISLISTTETIVSDSVMAENASVGVYLASSHGNSILYNTLTHNGNAMASRSPYDTGFILASGIYLKDSTDNLVANNTIERQVWGILLYRDAFDNALRQNTITGFAETDGYCENGIYLIDGPQRNEISNNGVCECNAGIRLWNVADNAIRRNDITRASSNGIDLMGSSGQDIQDNIIEGNHTAIGMYGAAENTLARNDFSNNNNGIVLQGSVANVIASNVIERNYYHGIWLHDGALRNVFSHNLVVANGLGASELEGPNQLNDNWWGGNGGPGSPGCNAYEGPSGVALWLTLRAVASPEIILADGISTSLITADMCVNALGDDTSGMWSIPDGVTFVLTTDGGNFGGLTSVSAVTAAGAASALLTSSILPGTATVVISAPPYAEGSSATVTVVFGLSDVTGDVNGDGVVNVIDVCFCLELVTGNADGTAAQRRSADIDHDGDLDLDDARILAEYVIGIRTTLP